MATVNPTTSYAIDHRIQLQFEPITNDEFKDAQMLIKHEWATTKQRKRVQCLSVKSKGDLYALEIKLKTNFDWSIEGAVAVQPNKFDSEDFTPHDSNPSDYRWRGSVIELVEFDEEGKSILYIDADDDSEPPSKGWFYIYPFDFHRHIYRTYNNDECVEIQKMLPKRLGTSRTGGANRVGNVPTVSNPVKEGLPILQSQWQYQWSVIWGPPGTGKTYNVGRQVAAILKDNPSERILIVSTTNKALDAAAIELGKASQELKLGYLDKAQLLRVGKGAQHKVYEEQNLLKMLEGTDTRLMIERDKLKESLGRARNADERAFIKCEINEINEKMRSAWQLDFLDKKNKAVCCTVFSAIKMLTDSRVLAALGEEKAPFTTVIIDEAGLISRIACSALSLLASRRVVLSGDSKQLSPIQHISRVHQPQKAAWIVSSGLSHLDDCSTEKLPANVCFLNCQRRMHPAIGNVISSYMYDGNLRHHSDTENRPFPLSRHQSLLDNRRPHSSQSVVEIPRALWCVLDREIPEKRLYLAEHGPGNRSWVRKGSERVLEKLFDHPAFGDIRQIKKGLYITPFLAQANFIQDFFSRNDLCSHWTASTVHSQQGQQAEMVIFDTVHAGSHGWSQMEWKRLVNVAISRAKEIVLVIASQEEMEQPYLSPLLPHLTHCTITTKTDAVPIKRIDLSRLEPAETQPSDLPVNSLGRQLHERKQLRPLLSKEQQKLCDSKIDGAPRLVRGVAGSGKTAVLGGWLVQCLQKRLSEPQDFNRLPFWVVYANESLQFLLKEFAETAWKKESKSAFPNETVVKFLHIREVLEKLKRDIYPKRTSAIGYDYDANAAEILRVCEGTAFKPHCEALFVDEGQDMGENTLKLLFSLVKNQDAQRPKEKSVYVFYDNAQNVYDRSVPNWTEMGINIRGGRATVMKESFRSTREISEFAINVFARLTMKDIDSDDMPIVKNKLLSKVQRNREDWWRVRFNNIAGPKPEFYGFTSEEEEYKYLGNELVKLLTQEKVAMRDICIICNKRDKPNGVREYLIKHTLEMLPRNVDFYFPDPSDFGVISTNKILVTTAQSFKGFDAEIVIIPSAEFYGKGVAGKQAGKILASPLYVAMTRARSILKILAHRPPRNKEGQKVFDTLQDCYATLCSPEPEVDDYEGDEADTEESDDAVLAV